MIICYCYGDKKFAAVGSRDRNGFVTFAPCSLSTTPVVGNLVEKVVFPLYTFFLLLE
jgi:hypothetical protein